PLDRTLKERGEMKPTNLNIHPHDDSRSIGAQARLLMSQSRQKQQNRQESMLHRAAAEIGINN
ncbi:MAG: hypothetical protein ACRDEA_00720, partial [Microcystaceae cyanobacterium]